VSAATEPEWDHRMDPLEKAQRTVAAYETTNTYLRILIRGAIADLESDRPRDHIAAALSAGLDSF
jgi:hypothetical protein